MITEDQLSKALDEIHICDPEAADMCEDVLEQLERKRDNAGADAWVEMIVKAAAGPRHVAAIKVRAEEFLKPSAVDNAPAAPPAVPAPPRRARRSAAPARRNVPRALGVAAIAFGLLLWVPGSRYALDGWTMAINVVLGLAKVGVTIPLAVGLWALLLFPLGIVYSIAEQKVIPARVDNGRILFLGWAAVIAWLLVHGTDVGATWLGVTAPSPDSWPVTQWVAVNLWASVTWSVVLTYIPEVLILAGWRWLGLSLPFRRT